MANTTYSFDDVAVTFSNTSFGQYVASGAGIGTLTVTMTTDRTVHDVAADGSIMVSKIKGRNGTVAIAVQQTSDLHKWLQKLYNYVETATTDQWAATSIVVRSAVMQELVTATGVSFQKIPDLVHQAQGQQRTWTLMAADVQQDIS